MELELKINGETRQADNTGNMFFKINDQMDYIENSGTSLCEGDLLLTGTPEGMGPVRPGDKLEAFLRTPEGEVIAELKKEVIHQQ